MSKKQEKVEKLDEFFKEIEELPNEDLKNNQGPIAKPYQCPSCHKSLSTRKGPCKHCGYNGYIPLSDAEIKKTRFIMFFIILAIAVVVYILTR